MEGPAAAVDEESRKGGKKKSKKFTLRLMDGQALRPPSNPQAELLLPSLIGDPVVSIDFTDASLLSGTAMGRVTAYVFRQQLPSEAGARVPEPPSAAPPHPLVAAVQGHLNKHFGCRGPFGRRDNNRSKLARQQDPGQPPALARALACDAGGSAGSSSNARSSSSSEHFRVSVRYPGTVRLLSAFSEDAVWCVRHVVVPRDIGGSPAPWEHGPLSAYGPSPFAAVLAVIGTAACHLWNLPVLLQLQAASPSEAWDAATARLRLDGRLTANLKVVVPATPAAQRHLVLIATSNLTVVLNLRTTKETVGCFKIPHRDYAVCDFDGTHALCLVRSPGAPFIVRLVALTAGPPAPNSGEPSGAPVVYERRMRSKRAFVTVAKLWAPNRIVLATNGCSLECFDCRLPPETPPLLLRGNKADVIALDASRPDRLLALAKNACLQGYDPSGRCLFRLTCKPATFFTGWPKLLTSLGDVAAFTADQGVYLLNLRGAASSGLSPAPS
eukprot:GHVT01006172.1.p1 GENE.GHVT01006172.1~~GHVT01006172.1.p1  ORF type:complete len:530 (-),score=124.98 GHVT01006172.1:389-1882(-)